MVKRKSYHYLSLVVMSATSSFRHRKDPSSLKRNQLLLDQKKTRKEKKKDPSTKKDHLHYYLFINVKRDLLEALARQ